MNVWKFALFGLLMTLGGCGASSGIVALSYTMNGISYASSGKGVADHALSAAADKDCAVLRMVQGVDVCASAGQNGQASLMTMIDSAPAIVAPAATSADKFHSTPLGPTSDRPAKPTVAKDSSRSIGAVESIYSRTK